MAKRVRKAVFPVAGLGTRFLPVTKAMPKEMLPVVDKPLIQYAFEEATAAGIEECYFVTGRAKNAIEDHFDTAAELEMTLRERGKDDLLNELDAIVPTPGRRRAVRRSFGRRSDGGRPALSRRDGRGACEDRREHGRGHGDPARGDPALRHPRRRRGPRLVRAKGVVEKPEPA